MTFPYNGYYIHINLLFDQKTNIFLNAEFKLQMQRNSY